MSEELTRGAQQALQVLCRQMHHVHGRRDSLRWPVPRMPDATSDMPTPAPLMTTLRPLLCRFRIKHDQASVFHVYNNVVVTLTSDRTPSMSSSTTLDA